mgnify:CR=1 FL=1
MYSTELYDEICLLLTKYESDDGNISLEDFYSLLVKIQNNWENITTCKYQIS